MFAGTSHNRLRTDMFLVQSITVKLGNINDKDWSSVTDELIDLLHLENLNLLLFKKVIKRNGDCQVITNEVIEGCKKISVITLLYR